MPPLGGAVGSGTLRAAGGTKIKAVSGTTSGADEALVAQAMASVSGLERLLWGWSIRRNVQRPGTRLSKMVPKYGVVAATRGVVGNIWLAPAFLGFISIPLLEAAKPSMAAVVIGSLLAGVAVLSLLMAGYRVLTAWTAARQWRHRTAGA